MSIMDTLKGWVARGLGRCWGKKVDRVGIGISVDTSKVVTGEQRKELADLMKKTFTGGGYTGGIVAKPEPTEIEKALIKSLREEWRQWVGRIDFAADGYMRSMLTHRKRGFTLEVVETDGYPYFGKDGAVKYAGKKLHRSVFTEGVTYANSKWDEHNKAKAERKQQREFAQLKAKLQRDPSMVEGGV